MPKCQNCQKHCAGDLFDSYCEPCAEFKKQVHEEEHVIVCQCGQVCPTPGAFDQHKWRCWYRDRFFHKGRKVRL